MEQSKKISEEKENKTNPWVDNTIRGMEFLLVGSPKSLMQTNKIEWGEINLEEIADFLSGFAFTSQDYSNKGLKIIRIQNLGNNKDEQFVYWNKEYNKKYLIKRGDLLLSLSGTVPVSFKIFKWDKEDALLNQRIVKINLKNNKIDIKYLSYVIQVNLIKIYSTATSTTGIANVNLSTIKTLKIPLPLLPNNTPDLKEQERIVSILEKAEKQKERGKKARGLLDEYLKAVFNEMFYNKRFKEDELGKICEIKRGGGSITKNALMGGNIPVIAGGQQPAYYHNISNRVGGTITVSGSGAYAGFVAYFNIPIYTTDCSTIQLKDKNIQMVYVYNFLKNIQHKIYKMQRGIAQPHVYPKDLASLKIPLPPLPLQEKFASIVEQVEKMKEEIKKTNANSEELFNSLMNKAFKGELGR